MYRYRIQYSVLVHTVNKGKISQDVLLYHVPAQPWTKRLYHEIFYCIQPWKRGCITRSFTVFNQEQRGCITRSFTVSISYTNLSYLTCIIHILTHIYPVSHAYLVSYTYLLIKLLLFSSSFLPVKPAGGRVVRGGGGGRGGGEGGGREDGGRAGGRVGSYIG